MYFFCCINFCPKQSCPGKSVKTMLLVEKHQCFHFSDLNPFFLYVPPTFSAQIVKKKCQNQPIYCTNIPKTIIVSEKIEIKEEEKNTPV